MRSFYLVWILLRALLACRVNLAMENLALRQQLAILKRNSGQLRQAHTTEASRLSSIHRRTRFSGGTGRPRLTTSLRELIIPLAKESTGWGVRRILSELKNVR